MGSSSCRKFPVIYFFTFVLVWNLVHTTTVSVDFYLDQAKVAVSKGSFNEALLAYDNALSLNPTNSMIYFRRGAVQLASGKTKNALDDFNKAIELQSDFLAAYLQRGKCFLKIGKSLEAASDFQRVLSLDSNQNEAELYLQQAHQYEDILNAAQEAEDEENYAELVSLYSNAIEIVAYSEPLRMARANAYLKLGDLHSAIGDVSRATKLKNDNTAAYFMLSTLYYELGESEQSLTSIRECLKLDQDNAQCHSHYVKVKKLDKQLKEMKSAFASSDWALCLQKAGQALRTEKSLPVFVHMITSQQCLCHLKNNDSPSAVKTCGQLISESNLDSSLREQALCHRGEAYLLDDNFEKALGDFKEALRLDGNSACGREGQQKAMQLKKSLGKRNYYKILGVPRTATKKEILKAYRKLSLLWHPDKYTGDDKEMADKKFIDINAAKEVLTDPEKKKLFDSGVDPLDPETSQQHNHPFFQQGFNPFGGGGGFHGGQTFTFHFG